MVTFNGTNTKLWEYGTKSVVRSLHCVRYLVLSNIQINCCNLLVVLPDTIPQYNFFHIMNSSFNFEAKTVCKFGAVGVNTLKRPKNCKILTPLSIGFGM